MRSLSAVLLGLMSVVYFGQGVGIAGNPQEYRVGDAKVWCIPEAVRAMDVNSIFSVDPAVLRRFVPDGQAPSAILTFLYQTGGKLVLADTGLGTPTGTGSNHILDGLAAIGFTPERVDVVVVTHMHGDHIGGLLVDDKPAFPNAVMKLGKMEHDYWLSEKNREENPGRAGNFDLARKVVDGYRSKMELFDFGDEIAPGLVAMEAIGHTPGHTALYLQSNGEKLLCFADLIHAAALQFPRPDMSPRYDMDPETAQLTRLRYLKMAAEEDVPVCGMHLPMPGIGRVEKTGDNSFEFVPGL